MNKNQVLILGGGVAGLSAGIYALKRGFDVTIAEQHTVAGGNLTGWNRMGYHIDNCIHWLTGTNPHSGFYSMWEDLGALGDDIGVVRSEKLFTYEKNGQSVSLWRNVDRMTAEMLAISPEDEKEIKKLRRAIKNIMFLSGVGGKDNDKSGNIFNKAAALSALATYNRKTVSEYGAAFHHPLLKEFFNCLTGPDFSMAAFVFVAATYCSGNGDIPEGGSTEMARHMIERYESLGGKLLTGKKAERINLKDKTAESVTFADGETIKADKIIVTFDPKMLFGKLMDIKLPNPLKKLYESDVFKRFSSIHAAFSVDAGEVPFTGTLMIDIPEDLQKTLQAKTCILREFSHEKKYAPDGSNILQTMIYVNEENAGSIVKMSKDRKKYKEKKEELTKAQMELIERQVPELAGKIKCLDSWTPASYARYVGTEIGSFMSFVMPARKLPPMIGSKVREVKNLFLATQWQTVPGGLPMAASAGKKAAEQIGDPGE